MRYFKSRTTKELKNGSKFGVTLCIKDILIQTNFAAGVEKTTEPTDLSEKTDSALHPVSRHTTEHIKSGLPEKRYLLPGPER